MKRRNLMQIKRALREGYAWPGGYPFSFLTFDGGALCADCVRKNWRSVCHETLIVGWERCGWGVQAVDVLWEGGNLCDNCGECLDAYPTEREEVAE